jgi:calcineurin-like phosphoesterase family protein
MRVLSNHGLVEVEKSSLELLESRGYSIHGCVHSWSVHVLNKEWDYSLAIVALKSVALHVPGEQVNRPWLTQRRLLQHAARCYYIVFNGLVLDNDTARAYFSLGYLFNSQRKLVEAEQMYQRVQGYEKALGVENITTYIPALNTIWNFGLLFEEENDLVKARVMYSKALTGYEKVVGPNHPKSHSIRERLRALDTSTGEKTA